MARVLFLPVFLIILALAVFLALRIRSMFVLSKSRDIVLSRPAPSGADLDDLAGLMVNSLNQLPAVQFQSEIHINYRKIIALSQTGPTGSHCKYSGKSVNLEIAPENGTAVARSDGAVLARVPRDNPWVDFWTGLMPLEAGLDLFSREGMKIITGNVGVYQQRNYTEILIISPALPARANQGLAFCAPALDGVYGRKLDEPGINIRNFMIRLLVNNLTYLPDHLEIKYNLFQESEFLGDYLQNSRLLY